MKTMYSRVGFMGHSWDIWGQKMVTSLHKQQRRETQNLLISLIYFVIDRCPLNILCVLKTGKRESVSWVRIPPHPPLVRRSFSEGGAGCAPKPWHRRAGAEYSLLNTPHPPFGRPLPQGAR